MATCSGIPSNIEYCEEFVITESSSIPQSPSSPEASHSELVFPEECTRGTEKAGIPKSTSGKVTKKNRPRPRSLKDKKCSSPFVMRWLEENYEETAGGCLPRSVLYTHYQDFCKRNQLEPSSAASFGKIIRLKFPNLRTRRLGTRGQSKYHYYGLAIKETSVYYRSTYSKKGLSRFSNACIKRESGQMYNPSAKTGILLPEFPKIKELNFVKPFPVDKVETFLLMYRAHCQRILDSIVRTNFHEIQDFLIHFWQGMPPHMLPILSSQATVDLVVICDFILYSAICEVLVPATLQPVPESLRDSTVAFSHNLVDWLFAALQDLPAALGIRKVQTAEMFGKCLRKESSLLEIGKNARGVLRNSETMSILLNDWRLLDIDNITAHATISGHHLNEPAMAMFREFARELEQMLIKQSSLEVYFEWLDSVIDKQVNEPAEKGLSQLNDLSLSFQSVWTSFNSAVQQELLITKGTSIESYSMIGQVLDEYVSYVVELLQYRIVERQYNNVLKVNCSPSHNFDPRHLPSAAGPPFLPPSPLQTPSKSVNYFQAFAGHPRPVNDYGYDYGMNPTLPCPSFPSISDGFCDHFFKQELDNFNHPSCSVPSTLPLEGSTYNSNGFIETPLTPQSSHHSLSSPLSHATLGSSPEPSLEIDYIRPHSQVSIHSVGSPNQADMPLLGSDAYSSASSACTSPLTHEPECTLNIAASLELVQQGTSAGYDYMHHERGNIASYPSDPYSAQLPTVSSYASDANGYPHAQYEYDLLGFMSSDNADDLLADPFGVKDTKPSLSQLSSPYSTPATTPIH